MSEALTFDSRQFVKYLTDSGFIDGLRSAGRGEKVHEAVRVGLRAIESDAMGTFDDMARDVLPRCVVRAVGWHIDGFHCGVGTKGGLNLVRNEVETGESPP